jgi:hypothetical protein
MGAKVAATGGSDNHYKATLGAQGPGQPTTWVFAEEKTQDGIIAGLKAGHTSISHQPPGHSGPRIYLEADGDGDGEFESMMGDTVPPGSEIRVRVENGLGHFIRLIVDGSSQLGSPVPVQAPSFESELKLPDDVTWVRAELFDPDLADERKVACDPLVGSDTTYCRNLLLVTGMTSALYLRP